MSPDRRGKPAALGAALILLAGCAAEGATQRSELPPDQSPVVWSEAPALPRPVANNAVAGLEVDGRHEVYSFMGLDSTKIWSGVHAWTFRWREGDSEWAELAPVPGPGRLAGTAQAVHGRIFVFGGYTVAEDGSEVSAPDVNVLDPRTGRWSAATPMPVPVDDAVSGVWRDSLVYLVSGWSDGANVPDVQIYDPALDAWSAATPIPGAPVFGHTGGLSGDEIVYVDGAAVGDGQPRFQLDLTSWRGRIDPDAPSRITWERLPDHPGPGLYRAAAVGMSDGVWFYAGTDNPYNYNGLGYDGAPAGARSRGFEWRAAAGEWAELPPLPVPSMDHRGLVRVGTRLMLVGGLDRARRVTSRVWIASIP